jgi:glycosyltransferase involved in cell wall biosynthesis
MNVLFIGKRHYTNRDALREKYGRIYQLPWYWAQTGIETRLWLVDYHMRENVSQHDGELEVISTPVRTLAVFRRWIVESWRKHRLPDVIIASGDCYIGFMAYRIARRLGVRFVFDVYDKYDEFGGYRRLPGFDPFRFLLQNAARRLFASRVLLGDLSPDPNRDLLVPNGVDTRRFVALDRNECRKALGLPQDVQLVGYFGGMEPDRGVTDLIDAIGRLRVRGMNVKLLLGGEQVAGVDVHADGVHYLGNVPYERMPTTLAGCDMLAVPYRRSVFMDAGASNKIAESIACRRPLVATRTPNLVANFPAQAERLGTLLATPGDASDLARVIREQSRKRVLVDMPTGMSWSEIARAVARQLRWPDHQGSDRVCTTP